MLHNPTNSNYPSDNTSNMLNNVTSNNLLSDVNCNENNTVLNLPNNHVNNGLNLSNLSNVDENITVNSIDENITLNKVNGNITSSSTDNINKEKVDLMIKLLEAQERVLDKAILLKDKEIKLRNLQLVFDDNKKVGENNHNNEQQLNFISNLSLNSSINLAALNKLNDI
ncbi:hypothetical protein K502DRAFT_85822 [Neoconidiobolus thromboides FSU 785]|nr:hypothetical protein K502DRAFT_85822 [Neoconidiobolus thromboides FSU 785]